MDIPISKSEDFTMKKLFSFILAVSIFCSMCVVNVFAAAYGDVNCDGSIKINDAVLLAQYLAQWNVDITSEGMEAADCCYDGAVNIKDAVLLAQYLARWQVTLGPGSGNNPGGNPGGDNDGAGFGDNEVPADGLLGVGDDY